MSRYSTMRMTHFRSFTYAFTMRMFVFLALIAGKAAAMNASGWSIILPNESSTGPLDHLQCALSVYSPLFLSPTPTTDVFSAMSSYGDKLLKKCTTLLCPLPDPTEWCGITTAAPTAVLPAMQAPHLYGWSTIALWL